MKLCFFPVLFILAFLSLMSNVKALGFQLSAGVREHYLARGRNGYGSDAAAKMKMKLGAIGFDSIALHTRLGIDPVNRGGFYLPALRSSKEELEVMISRIHHSGSEPILKPVASFGPWIGTPRGIPDGMGSDDFLFSSYARSLEPYLSILYERSIGEFVIGTGLSGLYESRFRTRWEEVLSYLNSRASGRTRFSIEISNESALRALEEFERRDPIGFIQTWHLIRGVRFSIPVQEYLEPRLLQIHPESLAALVRDRLNRVKKILPGRRFTLANVMLPACLNFKGVESEVECPEVSPRDPGLQARALRDFLQALAPFQTALDEVELMAATTRDEPLPSEGDPRYLLPNSETEGILLETLRRETHRSTSFLSPEKSAYRSFSESPGKKHACIYFDEEDSRDSIGAIHARMIENLVGAFPAWAKERRRIGAYRSGDLENCDVVFYLASNFGTTVPAEFLEEFAGFMKSHAGVWFNYKFDRLEELLSRCPETHAHPKLAFRVPGIHQADAPPTPELPDPGFFRYFHYHGEVFEKPARFDPATRIFSSSAELAAVSLDDPDRVEVWSHAEHSKSHELTPYIVSQKFERGGELFYVADLPFTYNGYEDRSLIFSDVIYDVLKEATPKRPPLALIRLEDINPSIASEHLLRVVDYLADRDVPFSMALIPYYSNLFQDPMRGRVSPVYVPIDRVPAFKGVILYAKARGANFVMHGVAHQAGDLISGFSGSSGSDYEFWSWPGDKPHPRDRADWVMKRIKSAESVFERLKIRPIAWEVPHYAGSALDYVLFGKKFEWNYHRGLYFKSEIVGGSDLSKLEVQADYSALGSQIFPYPIYEDSYGQALIPESLGMVDFPFYRSDTWREVSTPDDLIRRARKLRVVRGAIASFFWHPILLDPNSIYYREVPGSFETRGGLKTLEVLIKGLKDLGYQFASIGDCRWFPRKDCRL